MAEEHPRDSAGGAAVVRVSSAVFQQVEHLVYIAVGVMLSAAALLALAGVVVSAAHGLSDWSGTGVTLAIIDRLLFVLLLAEILHTVRASIRTGGLAPEPFLVVGLIATIRRVLLITLQTSEATKPGAWSPEQYAMVRSSMLELAVLGVLILVLVGSLCLLSRWPEAADRGAREGVLF